MDLEQYERPKIKLTDDMSLDEAGDDFANNPSLQTAIQYLFICMSLYEQGLCMDHTLINVMNDVSDFLDREYK